MNFDLFQLFYRHETETFIQCLEPSGTNYSASTVRSGNRLLSGSPPVVNYSGAGIKGDGPQLISKADLNRRDHMGRTLLHLACSQNRFLEAKALLDHPNIDIFAQDAESQWTPLHRALYSGSIAIARLIIVKDHSAIRIKDSEGLSPFDLYNYTLHGKRARSGRKSKSALQITGDRTEMYAFGTNANHNLGLGDSDDRKYPELIYLAPPKASDYQDSDYDDDLDDDYEDESDPHSKDKACATFSAFSPVRARQIEISKLHSAMVSSDDHLYLCGVGRNGRLGFGSDKTQLSYRYLSNIKVSTVALGLDHTVVISTDGTCYTWGSNKHGQLGYSVEPSSVGGECIQPHPKSVSSIKNIRFTNAAASSLHTVVYNRECAFIWGLDVGQMGSLGKSEPSCNHIIQRSPKGLSITDIRMVALTDSATACLFENGEVLIFSNFESFRIPFFQRPLASLTYKALNSKEQIRVKIDKIVAEKSNVACISAAGEIYLFSIPENAKSHKSIHPQCIWSVKRDHLRAVDVDVGQNGHIVLCTESGSMWQRIYRVLSSKKQTDGAKPGHIKDFKFARVPNLNRVTKVSCNDSFSSFAAIRTDYDPPIIEKVDSSFYEHMSLCLPLNDLIDSLCVEKSRNGTDLHKNITADDALWDALNEIINMDATESTSPFTVSRYDPHQFILLRSAKSPNITIPVHGFLLLSRSSILRQLVNNNDAISDISYHKDSLDGHRVIEFSNVGIGGIFEFCFFLYTDKFLSSWKSPKLRNNNLDIRDDLLKILRTLKLYSVANCVFSGQSSTTLGNDLVEAISDSQTCNEWADTSILLADGVSLSCHSFILGARSDYFAKSLSPTWLERGGKERQSDLGKLVDLSHIDSHLFEIVLDYIYSDANRLEEIPVTSLSGYINDLLTILGVATELSLASLVYYCEQGLIATLNMKNTSALTDTADLFSSKHLLSSLLDYICWNMECLLENGLLRNLDMSVLTKIEQRVNLRQSDYLPISRSGFLLSELEEKYPKLIENRRNEELQRCQATIYWDSLYPSNNGSVLVVTTKKRVKSRQNSSSAQARPSFTDRRQSTANASRSDLIFEMDDEHQYIRSPSSDAVNQSEKHGIPKVRRDSSHFGNYPEEPTSPSLLRQPGSVPKTPATPRAFKDILAKTGSTGKSRSPVNSLPNYDISSDIDHIGQGSSSSHIRPSKGFSVASPDNTHASSSPSTVNKSAIANTGSPSALSSLLSITPQPKSKISQKEKKKQRQHESHPNDKKEACNTSSSPWKPVAVPRINAATASSRSSLSESPGRGLSASLEKNRKSSSSKVVGVNAQNEVWRRPVSKQSSSIDYANVSGMGEIMTMQHEGYIRQEQMRVPRNLKDIQQEEEFMKWWKKESERVQEEERMQQQVVEQFAKEEVSSKKQANGHKHHRNNRNKNNPAGKGKSIQRQHERGVNEVVGGAFANHNGQISSAINQRGGS